MLTSAEILTSAHQTLDLESKSLKLLSDSIDDSFVQAVYAINETKGRVIVTGMGKSGHIGRKIAASLASLGTTAYFVHPGEASHGDLGMIEPTDIVIALSNSGEAPELSDIIAFCRRFNIKLIGMTGKRDSTLGRQSDIVLCLPPIQEACPFGLAPTTSTTLMLALGDALAIALLQLHNFSKDEYKLRHPGGKLGKMMLTVADLMHKGKEMPLVDPDTDMSEALLEMSGKGFGCVGVADKDGNFCGVFTDGDLRRAMAPDLLTKKIRDVMTRTPKTTTAQTLAIDALRIMNTTGKGITSLFVLDGKKPVGLLHMHDCLRVGVA
ncbi:MAG: KpsF/GutQ family sugar-phosphate isomerase [Alphaproteobacteria bacterium]|nr:KpsF/GutQ family sugar-phosphate isomerase [Alphaproteobacteria bacterium]